MGKKRLLIADYNPLEADEYYDDIVDQFLGETIAKAAISEQQAEWKVKQICFSHFMSNTENPEWVKKLQNAR